MIENKKIIVVGGGFAGIQLVERLDDKLFDILLTDKINHHQFKPLFYQVATSQIEPSSISFPILHVFKKKKNVQIRLADLISVNNSNKTVVDFPFVKFTSFLAWSICMFLHQMSILSMKNKLVIFINWAWAYISKDTSLRLILNDNVNSMNINPTGD